MAVSTPVLGDNVARAKHDAERCGITPQQRHLLVLHRFVDQLDLDALAPHNSLGFATTLCNWLPSIGARDEVIEDAATPLVGVHDAWKVFERIAKPLANTLAASADPTGDLAPTPLGDVTPQQFTDVVQGEDSRYLEAAGMAVPLQIMLADFARVLWDRSLIEGDEVPEPESITENVEDSAEQVTETTPATPDTEVTEATTEEISENVPSEGHS